MQADGHNKPMVQAASYPPLQRTQGRGTHCSGTGRKNTESRATVAGYTYSYDADGTRMEKTNGSSGTMYWPGPSGTLSETNLTGTINEEYVYFNGQRIARVDRPSGTVHYYFSNHLGSHTMVTSATGSCEQDIDYFPYGGVVIDHCPNVAQHYKFTGKERDSESGLDMFGARYYGSSLGRFMIPDWAAKPTNVPYASFGNPQSLNLYSYVENSPTTIGDPDGHCDACWNLITTVIAYVATHPAVAEALDKLEDSLGVKVSGGLGRKFEIGSLKLGLAVSVSSETRVDLTGKTALQATAAASVAGVGGQGNGTATFEKDGALVDPLDNVSGNAKLTGSGSHGDSINSNVAVGTDDRVGVGVGANIGVAQAGVQVTAGTQEVQNVAREVGNAVIQDTKQLLQDAHTSTTCGVGGCSTPSD